MNTAHSTIDSVRPALFDYVVFDIETDIKTKVDSWLSDQSFTGLSYTSIIDTIFKEYHRTSISIYELKNVNFVRRQISNEVIKHRVDKYVAKITNIKSMYNSIINHIVKLICKYIIDIKYSHDIPIIISVNEIRSALSYSIELLILNIPNHHIIERLMLQ